MKLLWNVCCLGLVCASSASAFQDYPQAIGDLVYRDSNRMIYGRDGTIQPDGTYATYDEGYDFALHHPGHVAVYVGNGQVVEARGVPIEWIKRLFGKELPLGGEVMMTPLAAARNVHSFYEDWGDEDGVEDHGHMGAKTHFALRNNPHAASLRQNIVQLALDQVGEGYDNDLSDEKGPGYDQWTCVGLAEAVYEWCNHQTPPDAKVRLPDAYPAYGDESEYAGGLNITPDAYVAHDDTTKFYVQSVKEFSQVPDAFWSHLSSLLSLFLSREFEGKHYVFFSWTQFNQTNLVDSFTEGPSQPTEVLIVTSAGYGG
ncbi:MAG: hypothetical protein AAB676_18045, partial [Verrucomicrobiota bacterium]